MNRKENQCEEEEHMREEEGEEKSRNPHETSNIEENVFETLSAKVKIIDNEKRGTTKLATPDEEGDTTRFQCANREKKRKNTQCGG